MNEPNQRDYQVLASSLEHIRKNVNEEIDPKALRYLNPKTLTTSLDIDLLVCLICNGIAVKPSVDKNCEVHFC